MFADLNTTYMERVDVIGNTAFLKFVERLLQADNAAILKAWVKAPDVGFFPIEYGFQPGGMDVPSEVNSTPTSFFSEEMRMKS